MDLIDSGPAASDKLPGSLNGSGLMRILLVDDNADITEIAAELLTGLGHICRTAASAADALAVVETFAPELAMLDIGLLDLSGYELLGAVPARLGPRPPYFAALTGQPDARAKALTAGSDHALVKPATRAQLCALIELAERKAPKRLMIAGAVRGDAGCADDAEASGAADKSDRGTAAAEVPDRSALLRPRRLAA